MYKRQGMSRRASKKVFKKFTGVHNRNNAVRYVMRGGCRM